MSALGYTTVNEAIVGWRCWRVLRFRRLDGTVSYRLAAAGTYGRPKLWEPRQPVTAQCSAFASDHEAPWPDHECGVWALNRPEAARRKMVAFMQTQSEPVAWACGAVSLWGRVIEHERGWRAQYAYPYALTLEGDDQAVANAIRSEYLVDVDWVGGELFAKALARAERKAAAGEAAQTEIEERRATARTVAADLRSMADECRQEAEQLRRRREAWERSDRERREYRDRLCQVRAESQPIVDAIDLSTDRVLETLRSVSEADPAGVHVSDVARPLVKGSPITPGDGSNAWRRVLARVTVALRQGVEEGAVVQHQPDYSRDPRGTCRWAVSDA